MELWLKLVLSAAVVLILVLSVWLFVTVYTARQKNAWCRSLAIKKMRRMSSHGGHTCLENVRLPYEGKTVRVDCMVIGTFGIVMMNAYDGKGSLYGSQSDKGWYYFDKENRKTAINNPLPRMDGAVSALRSVFADAGVYNATELEKFVVYENRVKLNLTKASGMSASVMNLRTLGKLLSRSKYEKEGRLDAEKAVAAVRKVSESI